MPDPFDIDAMRPDPLHLTFWPRLALGALLICSAVAVWWLVCAAVDVGKAVAALTRAAVDVNRN